jgi:signal transduction histidine kinase
VTVDLRLGDLPTVTGWAGPLGQVFLNLILNAQQAMSGPGTITVTSSASAGEVTVTVGDSGPGLPDHCRERLFEPGFSTKSQDEGTGLGLFISRRIVERHGGRITADNGPEGGAVFTVVLPAVSGGSAEAGS